MREIKFRAWDLVHKCWRDIYQYNFCFDYDYSAIHQVYVVYESWRNLEDGRGHPCELQQYTGLTDKNGKEIYEGDIIRYDNSKEMNKWVSGEIAVVVYIPARFVLRMKPFGVDTGVNQNVMKMGDCEDVIEVIGNIYEDGDLFDKN